MEHLITLIGITNARLPHRHFGIYTKDRFFHIYAIGKTGTGKSTLLLSIALQDIASGKGIAVIDPHGDLIERIQEHIPDERKSDLIYFNTPDSNLTYGYNPLRKVAKKYIPLAASGLLEAFKKLWVDAWGVRMEHVFRNVLYALIEYGEATLPDILRLLTDDDYRKKIVSCITNPQVKAFWEIEFPSYKERYRQESIAPIQNKVGAFLADPRLYRILTDKEGDIRLRQIMDEGKILLVNLAKGILGEDSASLLGSLLITGLSLAAFSRADTKEEDRRDFFVFIDEFQSFTTETVVNMVSELRKYRVGLFLTNQHLEQLSTSIRASVLGNIGTLLVFRVGGEDGKTLARELDPAIFQGSDLTHLGNYEMYIKIMINGSPSKPFSGKTTFPQHSELKIDDSNKKEVYPLS